MCLLCGVRCVGNLVHMPQAFNGRAMLAWDVIFATHCRSAFRFAHSASAARALAASAALAALSAAVAAARAVLLKDAKACVCSSRADFCSGLTTSRRPMTALVPSSIASCSAAARTAASRWGGPAAPAAPSAASCTSAQGTQLSTYISSRRSGNLGMNRV